MKSTNRPRGMILIEINPIILGGDPIEPQNKAWITIEQHFEMTRYWNSVIDQLRKNPPPPKAKI